MTVENLPEAELPSVLGLLTLLCKQGQKFVYIDGRIFLHSEFNEASNAAHKHELKGRDVTHLIREQRHAPESANVGTLIQKMEATEKSYRFWDRSFPFRMFLPATF
jgi:hypothetical protein